MANRSAIDKFIMSKLKVKILIPNSKESVRLPNKNRILRRYTLQWLDHEIKSLGNEYEVEVIELRNSKVAVDTSDDHRLGYKITALFCPDEVSREMRDLIEWSEDRTESSLIILLQLTQPMRRKGLLKDALRAIRDHDGYLVCSYVRQPFSEAWRVISGNRWNETIRRDKEQYLDLYDGALYGWQGKNQRLLWDYEREKRLIYNYTGSLVDVDTIEDYRHFREFQKMITETDNQEFMTCLKEYDTAVDHEREYNETVSYTDEQRDYDGSERRG